MLVRATRRSGWSASCAATCSAAAGRSTPSAAPSAGSRYPPGCSRPNSCRNRCSRPRRRRSRATTCRSPPTKPPTWSAPTCTSGCAISRSGSTSWARRAPTRSGLVLADTKFEFGELDGEIIVIDEMMTPDSSRYWPLDAYRVGTSPPSFDKQFVRDFMDSTGWDHEPPAPRMPADVIDATRPVPRGVRAAHRRQPRRLVRTRRVVGRSASWPGRYDRSYGGVCSACGSESPARHRRSGGRDGRARAAGARLHQRHPGAHRQGDPARRRRRRRRPRAQVEEMCERLLANPVIESYEVTITALEPTP